MADDRPGTVMQGGRRKAYRPIPPGDRAAALAAAIEAYERGDFFEAHELLEPAWMGTNDPLERELHQGLIKLAAAYIHGVRGNPAGVLKNLAGARARLSAVVDGHGYDGGLDLPPLLAAIERQHAALALDPDSEVRPPHLSRSRR